jgi:hypothetical protein
MCKEENIFQVIVEVPLGERLQSWHESLEEAEAALKECQELWSEYEFRIEPGTDYIYTKCKGCQTVHAYERHDAYGITTGFWCDDCYESDKYPYRKDRYPTMEHDGYGDYLEPEDY